MYIEEADEILIAGNYIGTDLTGSIDLGNGRDGILLSAARGASSEGPTRKIAT